MACKDYQETRCLEHEVDLDLCVSYYDGCNNCMVEDGKILWCTKRACVRHDEPKCLKYKEKIEDNTGSITGDDQIAEQPIGMPNPASKNCIDEWWKLEIRENEKGQYGVCIFDNGVSCEEWKLFRGECSKETGIQDPKYKIHLFLEVKITPLLEWKTLNEKRTFMDDILVKLDEVIASLYMDDKNHKMFTVIKDAFVEYKENLD